jgi:trk system potassium uptake protein TrkA
MKSKYVIIIGCGTLGSAIANQLSAQGHSIVMIDQNENSFNDLGSEYSGFKIHGDANEFFILSQAKVEKADLVLAVTNDDNLNIMLSQICQEIYNIREVIARVNKPKSAELFDKLGIRTICPTLLAASSLMEMITKSGVTRGDL